MKTKPVAFLLAGLLAGVVIGVVVVFNGSRSAGAEQRRPPTVGSEAGDFTLTDLDGNSVTLSDFKGQAVLINFWATWCPPCEDEMPLLEQVSQQYQGRLVVLGVDYLEEEDAVRQFGQKNGLNFPLLLDSSGVVADGYYVHNFPMTFFIDPQGFIRAQHMGLLTESQLVRYLKTIGLEEK